MLTIDEDGQMDHQAIPTAGIGGDIGSTDNRVLRSDGTGGETAQGSPATLTDNCEFTLIAGASTATPLTVIAAAGQSANLLEIYNSSSVLQSRITGSGELALGDTSRAVLRSTNNSILITAHVPTSVVASSVTINPHTTPRPVGQLSVSAGWDTQASALRSIAIGSSNLNSGGNSFKVGYNITCSVPNVALLNYPDWYGGNGVTNASPTSLTINGTGGSGTNVVGGDVSVKGGVSTGNAAPGKFKVQAGTPGASGATLQALSDVLVVDAAGVVRIIGLPTSDPVVANQLWNDGGTLKVSAG